MDSRCFWFITFRGNLLEFEVLTLLGTCSKSPILSCRVFVNRDAVSGGAWRQWKGVALVELAPWIPARWTQFAFLVQGLLWRLVGHIQCIILPIRDVLILDTFDLKKRDSENVACTRSKGINGGRRVRTRQLSKCVPNIWLILFITRLSALFTTVFDASVCHPLNTDSPLALCHYHITFLMCGSRESTDSWQMAVDRSRGALNGASIDPQGLWIPSIHKPRDPIEFPEWSQQSISLVHWWILSHKHIVGVRFQ